jgi:hypothetical protein
MVTVAASLGHALGRTEEKDGRGEKEESKGI